MIVHLPVYFQKYLRTQSDIDCIVVRKVSIKERRIISLE